MGRRVPNWMDRDKDHHGPRDRRTELDVAGGGGGAATTAVLSIIKQHFRVAGEIS